MPTDVIVIDWVFVFLAVILSFWAFRRIISYRSISIADYVIVLIFVFNCIPVFLDLIIGVPEYVYWYKPFEKVIADFNVCLVYNFYVIVVLAFLNLYIICEKNNNRKRIVSTEVYLPRWRTKTVDICLIFSPILYVVFKYGFSVFSGYTQLHERGIDSGGSLIINQLILLGMYIYITRFFSVVRKKRDYILMIFYFFVLIWLNGKRYMIVTIGEAVFFLYQMTKRKNRKRLKLAPVIGVCVVFTVVYSVFYLSNVKVSTATDFMYGTLRVDFGRDDVTKYVIDTVLFNKEKILDYPGQSFLSALLFFVPRGFWASKPYPHYMYLTASILDVSIHDIPAGTTPSLFEMSLCNFGWMGIIITVGVLIVLCRISDKSTDLSIKVVMLLILTNILSQSLDAVIILLLVLVIQKTIKYKLSVHGSSIVIKRISI